MDNIIETLLCGCRLHKDPDGITKKYEPCLSCALTNAGQMLQEAAKRIKELSS